MPVKKPSGTVDASTQLYLKIAEIHDDTVVLKNGGLRAVLDVTTMNLSLKSEQEQNAIVGSYQEFLNVLDFPIQILIRSKRKDVDGYLENMVGLARKQQDPLMRDQTYNYINFISSLVKNQAIMEKRFYVVVPYDPSRAKTNFFSNFMNQLNPADSLIDARIRNREFESLSKSVRARINVVAGALGRIGLATKRLNTNELIELFYQYYNPSTSGTQKLHHLNESNLSKMDIALEEQLRLSSITPATSMPGKKPAKK